MGIADGSVPKQMEGAEWPFWTRKGQKRNTKATRKKKKKNEEEVEEEEEEERVNRVLSAVWHRREVKMAAEEEPKNQPTRNTHVTHT